MGLGQSSRGAPPSCIQLSSGIVTVLRGLDYGVMLVDPITRNLIHTVGSMFVDNIDLLKKGEKQFAKLQEEINAWGNLIIATVGCLKTETCCWYLFDYDCVEGLWEPVQVTSSKIHIPSDTGAPAPILTQPQPT